VYCANEENNYSRADLDENAMKHIAVVFSDYGIKHVHILGGEPSVIPCFDQVLDELLKHSIHVSFSTNGWGITQKTVDILKQYQPDTYRINVSLDSIVEEHNDANRGKGSYAIAMRAISLLKQIPYIKLTVFSVITEVTKYDLTATYESMKSMDIYAYGVTPVLATGRGTQEMVIPLDEYLLDAIIDIVKEAKENQAVTRVLAKLGYVTDRVDSNRCICNDSLSDVIFRRKCNTSITKLHIDSNGDVYPCDMLKQPCFRLGNIFSSTFEEIWHNDICAQLAAVRRNDKRECRTCNIKTCSTGCMGLAYKEYGDILRKDPNCPMGC
jgi:radical SAM protein with 4Fe4S-binding SPASM domain